MIESDRRVRNALKLIAFYSELYITSRDPHMCVVLLERRSLSR